MRITVDTNVLISATFWYGDSYRIIDLAEKGSLKLVLSKEIIEEYFRVLGYGEFQTKITDKNLQKKKSVEKIASVAIIVEPKELITVVEDPKDNKVLECAFEGKASYIVTQDNHLLKLKEFRGIKIITPVQFLEVLGKK